MAGLDNQIVIKRVRKAAQAHHGGAWKIAYADFVTAMMAFFLLLWLISMTTPEQKKGLANYFAPPSVSESQSGAGGVMGGTAPNVEGAEMAGNNASKSENVALAPESADLENKKPGKGGRDGNEVITRDGRNASNVNLSSTRDLAFHSAAASVRQAWQSMPNITDIENNLLVQETPEGLDIEIMNQAGRSMFPEGSKFPFEATRKAIAAVAPILQKLSAPIAISGHTAAGGAYDDPHYGSWELSADRANVVRGILGEFGVSEDRFDSVSGRSSAEPFFPNDPYLTANERVKITVLFAAPPVPPGMAP